MHTLPLAPNSSGTYSLFVVFNPEEVTRDYLPDVEDPLVRDCCLLPWFPDKLMDEEWIKQLSAETTLESARNKLKEIQMKVCLFVFVCSGFFFSANSVDFLTLISLIY